MFLLIMISVLVRIPRVQTVLIHKISDYLSSELHTNVKIGSIQLELVKKLVLRDFYVEDLHHDTLLYAPKLKIEVNVFNRRKRNINFTAIELQSARIKLQRYAVDENLNFQFIVDYFSTSTKDSTKIKPWNVTADNFKLTDITFSMIDHHYQDHYKTVNFQDLRLDSLNTHFKNIRIAGDSLYTDIKNVSFKEKTGFNLKHFAANAKFAPNQMRFNNLDIITSNSHIINDIVLSYNTFGDFQHFLSKVQFNAEFKESKISTTDIAFFTSDLGGFDRSITLSGLIKGTVDKMKGKNLAVHYGNKTVFKGNVTLEGLPVIEETFIDLVVDDLITDSKDIASIPVAPFNLHKTIELPAEIGRLGLIRFNGKFTGFYKDFVAYGNLNTALGYISSDINLKLGKTPVYAGHITSHNFDIGKFFASDNSLGKLTMNAEVKGKYFDVDRINAVVTGNISNLGFLNYNYHNIVLDGTIAKKLFNGALSINEENLQLNFDGKIDYSLKVPVFDFKAKIKDAKLAKLNFIKRDSSSTLSLVTDFYLTGNNFDNIDGYTKFKNIEYSELDQKIQCAEIALQSTTNIGSKQVLITSDFVDADITGQYKRTSVVKSFMKVIQKYLPYVAQNKLEVNDTQNFSYKINLKNTDQVLNIFLPALRIAPNTTIDGNFSTLANDFKLKVNTEKIVYGDIKLDHVSLNGKTTPENFDIDLIMDDLIFRDSVSFRKLSLIGKTGKDSAYFNFHFNGKDSTYDHLDLRGDIDFSQAGKTAIHILPSDILIEGYSYVIDSNNQLLIDTSTVELKNFILKSGEQQFGVEGKISSKESDKVVLNLKKFETHSLNKLLNLYGIQIGGVANGTINIAGVTDVPQISSDLNITNFSYYNDTLGNASIKVDFKTKSKIIDVNAVISRGDVKNITINGKYYIKPKQDELDFLVALQKTNMQPFGHFINSFASDVRGYISGDFRLSGLANKPILTGSANLQKASFIVDYLNTRYSFSDFITISEDGFYFNNITLNDDNGNQATANGKIYHENFKKFGIDLTINANKFKCLNTTKSQNELFYGTAYASGLININGPFEYLNFNGTAVSQKGTHIFIPLSNPDEVGSSGFITFVTHDTVKVKTEAETVDLSGVSMDFTFEATPDAEIDLVFDEKIGDIMKANGTGTIKMEIDQFGTFNMFGEYVVERGDYLFTLQNVINKRFDVENGSLIKWNGSPYDAIIDMKAKYKLRASLYDLLQDTTDTYKKRTDVFLILSLKNRLMNPDISFKIEIPNIDPTTESFVRSNISTEQDVNNQTLSLLVLNRFQPGKNQKNAETSGGTFGSTASEFLSNQLSNWAQSLTNAFDIGVNYKPKDKLNSDELEVILSTKLFSDRVTLDGVVGYSGTNETTQRASSIVGDFNVDVQVSNNGRFHFKAFNRSNNNSFLNYFNSLYTQGIGFFYRQDFDTIGDLFKKHDKPKTKKDDETSAK